MPGDNFAISAPMKTAHPTLVATEDSAILRAIQDVRLSEDTQEFPDDLRSAFDTFRRRWLAFLLGFLATLVAAVAYLALATPQFTATAVLVLDPRKQVVTTSPEVLPDADPNSSMVDTQVELIQSRAVIGRAVDELGLKPKAVANGDSPGLLKVLLGKIRASGPPAVPASEHDVRENLIDDVSSGLHVSRVDLTLAIHISHTSSDPHYSADVANAVAVAYRAYQAELKRQATRDANQWLTERVAELRERVEKAESEVDNYRSRSGLLVAKGSTSSESQLTGIDVGINEAQQSLNEASAKLNGYRAAARHGAAEAAKIVATPTMQQLRAQYVALTNQQAQLSPTLGPSHPQMIELKRQIASLQVEINTEANRTIQELSSDVTIASNKIDGLRRIREQSRSQLARDNAASVELVQLQASAQSLRSLYEDMVTRLQQTTAQSSRSQVSANVVSSAFAPTKPASPRPDVVLSGAVALGLTFGALAAMLAQFFDSTVGSPQDLERRTRIPVLALVPHLRSRELVLGRRQVPIAQFVLGRPLSLFTEAFRNLRVAVRQSVGRDGALVVQITSGTFAEGKSVSSIAFAQAAAMDGRRVLLIDADVRRRSLTKYLGITTNTGLMELLRGEASLNEVLLAGGDVGKPHVIPLSTNEAGPHDGFSGQMFGKLLQRLREGFDLIIIDSAPVLAVAESLVLATRVDAVVVVVRWSRTPLETVLKALEAISRAGGRVAGMLLTQVDIKSVTNQAYGRRHYSALKKYYQ